MNNMAISKSSQATALEQLEELLKTEKELKKDTKQEAQSEEQDVQDEDFDVEQEEQKQVVENAKGEQLEFTIKAPQRRKRTNEVSQIGIDVVAYLDEHVDEWFTAAQLKRAGFGVDSNIMKRVLQENLAKKTGERRGTHYTSLKTTQELNKNENSTKVKLYDDSHKAKVFEVLKASDDFVKNADIASETGFELNICRECLNDLITEGKVIKEGERRGSKYKAL